MRQLEPARLCIVRFICGPATPRPWLCGHTAHASHRRLHPSTPCLPPALQKRYPHVIILNNSQAAAFSNLELLYAVHSTMAWTLPTAHMPLTTVCIPAIAGERHNDGTHEGGDSQKTVIARGSRANCRAASDGCTRSVMSANGMANPWDGRHGHLSVPCGPEDRLYGDITRPADTTEPAEGAHLDLKHRRALRVDDGVARIRLDA